MSNRTKELRGWSRSSRPSDGKAMVRDIWGRGPAYSRPFHPARKQRGKGGARIKGAAKGGTSASRSNLLFPGIKGKHLSNREEELDWFKGQSEEGVKPGSI